MKTLYDCRQKGELMVYTIGQFSKIGRVSTKTLRYYDEIELLKPVHVDRDTQYRYYSYEQVLKLISICELKEYGLKLEQTKAIMDKQEVDLLKQFLNEKLGEINKEVENSLKLRDSIEEKIKKIESGGKLMEAKKDLKVELKERQPLVVISRRTITSMSNISSVIGKVFEDIFKMNLKPEGPAMTVYHYKQEFDIENADCEICIPVNSSVNAEKNEKIKEFKGGLVAATTFVGPYSRLGEAYAKVMNGLMTTINILSFHFKVFKT